MVEVVDPSPESQIAAQNDFFLKFETFITDMKKAASR